jgi:hypothetical protein
MASMAALIRVMIASTSAALSPLGSWRITS